MPSKRITTWPGISALSALIAGMLLAPLPVAADGDGFAFNDRARTGVSASRSGNSISVEAWAGGTTGTTNTAGTTATEFDSTAWTRWALSPCSTIMKPAANTGALFTPETKKQAATSQGIDCTTPNTATTIATTAHHAIATMTLPDTHHQLDPDPTTNQWHAAAVGQQLWFTLDNPGPQHTTTTNTDITITLTATPGAVTINHQPGHHQPRAPHHPHPLHHRTPTTHHHQRQPTLTSLRHQLPTPRPLHHHRHPHLDHHLDRPRTHRHRNHHPPRHRTHPRRHRTPLPPRPQQLTHTPTAHHRDHPGREPHTSVREIPPTPPTRTHNKGRGPTPQCGTGPGLRSINQ
ncbi:Hypothetical protein CB129slpB_1153 [Propionibacterium freudenreichii]|nr:Hypothetical protein CB129slpB_1153 [Propionibacterium freudenreichii]